MFILQFFYVFVNWFLYFLHSLSKAFGLLYNHYSEIFFRKFSYFLFIYLDFCVSSLLLHLCSISLPFHYYLLMYCVWGLLFPSFKAEFFLPFVFCSPKFGPVACVSFVWGEICAEFLFVFPLMGKAEWGGNPVCWWLGLYFCFVCCLDEASCTGCYWWLGLVFKWFPLCEFSLFDTP